VAKKTTSKKTGQGSDQFQLRLPDGMRKQLARVAERNGRSMNAEVVEALSLHFDRLKEGSAEERGAEDRRALKEMFEDLIREIATEVVTSGGDPSKSAESSGSKEVRDIIRDVATEVVNESRSKSKK